MTLPLALAIFFGAGWIPVFAFRTESLSDVLPAYGAGERTWVFLSITLLGLHVTGSCLMLSLSPSVPAWRAASASLVFAGGLGFWFWARSFIGPWHRRRHPDEPPLRFRRDGPFSIVRNPLYLGTSLAAAAPALAAGRPLLACSFAACVLALYVRAAQEERRLHEQIGPAYAEYCRRVKRLIPYVC